MNYYYRFFSLFMAILMTGVVFSQSFTFTTPYDSTFDYEDTLFYAIPTSEIGAWGDASLTVDFDGDFGGSDENISFYGEDGSLLGSTDNNPEFDDCEAWTSIITFDATPIDTWASDDDTLRFYGICSQQVDFFCDETNNSSVARITLDYTFCELGTPQIATITNSELSNCSYEPVLLTATPMGGVFTGTGVEDSIFNANGFAAGQYPVTYTVTDAIGCETFKTVVFNVAAFPNVDDVHVCPSEEAILTSDNTYTVWSIDNTFANTLDTSANYQTTPITQPSTYYAAHLKGDFIFTIDTLTALDSMVVDHDNLSNDDNGGIAVTNDYIYVVGDDNTARFDLDLTNGISLPQRNGIFSNLADGQLYTLHNGENNISNNFYDLYSVTELRSLNPEDLTLSGNIITLSEPIPVSENNDQSGVFAGYNQLILYSGENNIWYQIDMNSGFVTSLGTHDFNHDYSENWAFWGVAEFDGTDYSALYRDDDGDFISRLNLTSGVVDTVAVFDDLSDLASFTYSPSNERWYFHYENDSDVFGGDAETLGYAYASASDSALAVYLGCFTDVEVTIDMIDLGEDQELCADTDYSLMAPTGYLSYAWNGVQTDANVFDIDEEGEVSVLAEAADGCIVQDTVLVSFFEETEVTLNIIPEFVCDTLEAVVLDGGFPVGGDYMGEGVTNGTFNPSIVGAGGQVITYTFTDANGCKNEANDALYVDECSTADLSELVGLNSLSMYPNPSQGAVKLSVSLEQSSALSVSVMDVTGRVIYNYNAPNENTTFEVDMNLNNAPSGMYMVHIQTANNNYSERLMLRD